MSTVCQSMQVYCCHFFSPQLIARTTKHGWFDGDKKVFVFRDILDEAGKFLRVRSKKMYFIADC